MAYRRERAAALVQGNRAASPPNTVPEGIVGAVVVLGCEKYAVFNHSHFTGVPTEREGIRLSRQTESLLNLRGLASAKR